MSAKKGEKNIFRENQGIKPKFFVSEVHSCYISWFIKLILPLKLKGHVLRFCTIVREHIQSFGWWPLKEQLFWSLNDYMLIYRHCITLYTILFSWKISCGSLVGISISIFYVQWLQGKKKKSAREASWFKFIPSFSSECRSLFMYFSLHHILYYPHFSNILFLRSIAN